MNNTGGPLTYRDKPILVNGAAADDLAVFTDTVKTIKMLNFKKHGITLPAKEVTGGSLIGSYSRSKYYPGSYKMVNIVINPDCPCEDCNYNYALAITSEIQNPGVFNSQWVPERRTYASFVPAIGTCNGTKLSAADILTIETELLKQIHQDDGRGSYDNLPNANGGPGAVVYARRYYIIDADETADSGFTVTKADGTTYVYLTTHSGTTAGLLAIQFNANANVNTILNCIRIGASKYMIISKDEGYVFTLGTLVSATQAERGINLRAKYIKLKFYVNYDGNFCTHYGVNWYEITDSAATFAVGGVDMEFYTDGAKTLLADKPASSPGSIKLVADINGTTTGVTTNGFWASSIVTDTTIVIANINQTHDYWMALTNTSIATVGITNYTGSGSFERLSMDEVYREFSQLPFDGILRSQHRVELPLLGSYCDRFVITCNQGTYGLHGASHGAGYRSEVIAYVRTDVADAFETLLSGSWLV